VRFVGASFAHVSAPCIGPEESPAEAGLRSTASGYPRFRSFKTLTQELWFQPGVGRPKQETIMPRELIEPRTGDKRYVRRKKGKFTTKQASVGRSLTADRRSKAKRIVPKGEGDRGESEALKVKKRGVNQLLRETAVELA
jgi:hypothetical protein